MREPGMKPSTWAYLANFSLYAHVSFRRTEPWLGTSFAVMLPLLVPMSSFFHRSRAFACDTPEGKPTSTNVTSIGAGSSPRFTSAIAALFPSARCFTQTCTTLSAVRPAGTGADRLEQRYARHLYLLQSRTQGRHRKSPTAMQRA